jgi:hypothetical protein
MKWATPVDPGSLSDEDPPCPLGGQLLVEVQLGAVLAATDHYRCGMRYECPFVGGPRDGEVELLPVNTSDELPVRFDDADGHYVLSSVRTSDGERWQPMYRYISDED